MKERERGDIYRPRVQILKINKNSKITKIKVSGDTYILQDKGQKR